MKKPYRNISPVIYVRTHTTTGYDGTACDDIVTRVCVQVVFVEFVIRGTAATPGTRVISRLVRDFFTDFAGGPVTGG